MTTQFATLREKIAYEKAERAQRYADYADLMERAHSHGRAAHDAITPVPMIVGSPTHPLGSDIDPSKPTYFVGEGACGFAWVVVSPGTSAFARWLTRTGHAGRHYKGGVLIWIRTETQSLERKQAYAAAMAHNLRHSSLTEGLTIYTGSRMD